MCDSRERSTALYMESVQFSRNLDQMMIIEQESESEIHRKCFLKNGNLILWYGNQSTTLKIKKLLLIILSVCLQRLPSS